jgi:hypothetical protein
LAELLAKPRAAAEAAAAPAPEEEESPVAAGGGMYNSRSWVESTLTLPPTNHFMSALSVSVPDEESKLRARGLGGSTSAT